MVTFRRPHYFAAMLLTAVSLACSALGGAAGDAPATETAIAAQVMTQIAPSAQPGALATQPPLSATEGPPTEAVADPIAETCSESDQFTYTDLGVVMDAPLAGFAVGTSIADSTAVLLPDGRIRMYFQFRTQDDPPQAGHLSAISDDGITFALEEGIRLQNDEWWGPHVKARILDDGRLRIYKGATPGDPANTGIVSYISEDWLTFVKEDGFRITPSDAGMERLSHLTMATMADGTYRGYFSNMPQGSESGRLVKSAASADLLTWTVDPGVRVGPGAATLADYSAEQPHALQRAGGCVTLFYYSTHFQGQFTQAQLRYSTSTDGLTFNSDYSLGLNGNGPDVVRRADGTYLLYYDAGDPERGWWIGVGVLSLTTSPAMTGPAAGITLPTPVGPTPPFNPFQNLTAEQAACLQTAWGEQAFQEILSFARPPTQDEGQAMAQCNLTPPQPGGPAGTPGPGQPGGTPGAAGPPAGGPFNDQTYFTTSTDGLTWAEGRLLAEHASVPEVVRTSQGVFWAYWVDFSTATGPNTEKIGVARSTDGAAWEMLGTVNFTGIGSMTPVDPDAMELPDGRLRMYFYDIAGTPGQNTIYSAVSTDGLNYALESGARLTLADIYDPNVVLLPDGRYRMYLNRQDIISATSNDGLTFTQDDGVRVEKGAVPGAIVLPDGSVRLYACVDGISVYKSADGLDFSLEKKSVIGIPSGGGIICDPSVTAMPGGYLMVYKFSAGR